MKIEIRQTISNTLDENRNIIKTSTAENYVLYPAEGKQLKNIKTGKVYPGFVSLGVGDKIKDFIELEK